MGRKGIMENRGGRHDDGMKISRHPISERRDRKRDRKGDRKERERERLGVASVRRGRDEPWPVHA